MRKFKWRLGRKLGGLSEKRRSMVLMFIRDMFEFEIFGGKVGEMVGGGECGSLGHGN